MVAKAVPMLASAASFGKIFRLRSSYTLSVSKLILSFNLNGILTQYFPGSVEKMGSIKVSFESGVNVFSNFTGWYVITWFSSSISRKSGFKSLPLFLKSSSFI